MRTTGLARVCGVLVLPALCACAATALAEEPIAAATHDTKEQRESLREAETKRAREALKQEVAKFGLVAIVEAALSESKEPAGASWERARSPSAARAKEPPGLWTATIADALGAGGLQLTSTGEDAGPGVGVPLRRIATLGHGDGLDDVDAVAGARGRIAATYAPHVPTLRPAAIALIPPEAIQRIVRQSFGRFRVCYEGALRTKPTLRGRIAVKFTIDPSGAVSVASDGGSDLQDAAVVSCVVRGFATLTFPPFDSGHVTVVYPLAFAPAP